MPPRQGLARPFPTSAEQNMLRPFCPIKQGRAMPSEWPEVSSPKGPGTCCHPRQSISFSSTHCIALFLHTWCLLRARLNLSRGKKPIIPWDASSVLSAIASGSLHGVIQTTFPLPVSLLTVPGWRCVPLLWQRQLLAGGCLPMHRPGPGPSSFTSSCAPCHRPGTWVSTNALPNSRKIKSGYLAKFCLWLFEPITYQSAKL